MFLGVYRFEGDASALRAAYERMLDIIPHTDLTLHICVADQGGLTIIDTCPSKERFLAFSSSPEFKAALNASGLPTPKVTPMGEVNAAFAAGSRMV